MANQTITADFTSSISVTSNNDVLVIKSGVTGVVDGIAIDARAFANFRELNIAGDVTSLGNATCLILGIPGFGGGNFNSINILGNGVLRSENGTALSVSATNQEIVNKGLLEGKIGIDGQFLGARITNEGTIRSEQECIAIEGDAVDITHEGTMKTDGATAVTMNGENNRFFLFGTVKTAGDGPAVNLISDGDNSSNDGSIDVFGKLISQSVAIEAEGGLDLFIAEDAIVRGDIVVGDGSSNVTLDGQLDGTIFAGSDLCIFDLGSKTADIVDGGGIYVMRVTIDTTLPDFFVSLELQGKADIDGTGNDLDNNFTENVGDNILKGRGGADGFLCNEGDDTYFLGRGADVLFYQSGRGNDEIMDFAPGKDLVDVFGRDIESFEEIRASLFNVEDGVEFRNDGDVLFFRDVKKSELTPDSFDF